MPASVLLAAALLTLAACSSTIDMLPEKLGGLPSDAPQRPATTLPTPNVYEVRPTREARPLSNAEQKKLESELTTLRESEKQRANPPPPPPPPEQKAAARPAGPSKPSASQINAPAGQKAAADARAPAGEGKAAVKGRAAPKKSAEPMKLVN